MKFVLVLLALLPLAFSMTAEDRGLFDLFHFGFPDLIDTTYIKNKVQEVLNVLGSDATEQQCESACHGTFSSVDESHLIHTICTPLCRSFQSLVNLFGLRPQHSSR
ncbi:uncharacterized protein LOC143282636 [Babylonia areolata]|uniref:uncharacterized protein LOC143282636 n=1 Tax=Babylonia areolata TaxID=304850 RepID=UPI003FD1CFF0